jgi:hypothetical protein
VQAHVACNRVYEHALHGHEKGSEIVARLGKDHPDVRAWTAAVCKVEVVYAECRRRYGPKAVTFNSQWDTFLALEPNRKIKHSY